jgi:hypothetical protein
MSQIKVVTILGVCLNENEFYKKTINSKHFDKFSKQVIEEYNCDNIHIVKIVFVF